MKRKIFFGFLILSIITLIGVSCKTAQAKETSKADQADIVAASASKVKADQARKQAMDFSGNTYFPSDWEKAEGIYKSANDAAKYNAATDAYNDIFRKAVPLYAQAKEDELMAIREQLIATGFTDIFPQYLKNADDLALEAKEKYDAKDYYAAKNAADLALNEYNTLLTGAKVYLTRQEIINRSFAQYDADNFFKADLVAQSAIEAYNSGDKTKATTDVEEALLRYNLVLSNAWTIYAAERKEAAAKERQLAVSDRANIASRETFRKGDASLAIANESFDAEVYTDAAIAFVEAEAIFAVARKETEEKRVRAEEAIRVAEEKIEESSGSALEAEKIIEGGSK